MSDNQTFQQGDVLIRRRADLDHYVKNGDPRFSDRRKGKRLVLAEGEATGHAHVLEVEQESDAELIRIGEAILLNLTNGGTITHEEHKPVEVPAGVYEVGKAQEFDYAAEEERQVTD